ncbi:Ribokinase-like protein [Laetiporus sulphureus 93-53]|uniref:pyridoxal kinase n=1 Tax=Laetiporus sulphureus 93-53 TaxID=1314785 RepID=A0A165EJZ3_9APHY|nr:Ribokinase-like protein [Laetiporus sulphureus 93-53]KZT07211.1 Ribokinase-like protein [Laetiporus sulphureus 93-53]
MSQTDSGRVLSIQSHVTFGYVGGKAAVFPLQCLGYDVDVVNTVNFSNHSGYGRFGGSRTSAAELAAIFQLMEQNGLLLSERLLTVGYIPGAEALSTVKELAAKMRANNTNLIYLLDPVLGDSGKLYVAPDTIPVYREALQHATIITPNWFEVEVLTDIRISDMNTLRRAIQVLHTKYHVPNVVVSSIPLQSWLTSALPSYIRPGLESRDSDFLVCIASSVKSSEPGRTEDGNWSATVHAQCIPCIPGYFSGVGDLFSALLLGHFKPSSSITAPHLTATSETETPLSRAVSQALTKTHAILTLTHEHAVTLPEEDRLPTDDELDASKPDRKIRRMRGRELRLIQAQDIIRGTKQVEYRQMVPWTDFWQMENT